MIYCLSGLPAIVLVLFCLQKSDIQNKNSALIFGMTSRYRMFLSAGKLGMPVKSDNNVCFSGGGRENQDQNVCMLSLQCCIFVLILNKNKFERKKKKTSMKL